MGKAVTTGLKELTEEKAYGPEHILDKEGTSLNRKKMALLSHFQIWKVNIKV